MPSLREDSLLSEVVAPEATPPRHLVCVALLELKNALFIRSDLVTRLLVVINLTSPLGTSTGNSL